MLYLHLYYGSGELGYRKIVFLDEYLLLVVGKRFHVCLPAGAKVGVPPPQAPQEGLGFFVVFGAKGTRRTSRFAHLILLIEFRIK